MAKQLLGKEVTAALNEKIKANVAELEAKGVKPTLGIIRVGEREDDLSYERGANNRDLRRCIREIPSSGRRYPGRADGYHR